MSERTKSAQTGSHVDVAYRVARLAHEGDYRKVNHEPFITHPLDVASRAAELGDPADEEFLRILGVLHDVIDMKKARVRFPLSMVTTLVGENYRSPILSLSKTIDPTMTWREKCEEYLPRAEGESDPRVQIVRVADKVDNLRKASLEIEQLGNAFWNYFKGDREGYIWWPHAVRDAVGRSGALDGHPALDLYDAELAIFDQTVEQLDSGLIVPLNRGA